MKQPLSICLLLSGLAGSVIAAEPAKSGPATPPAAPAPAAPSPVVKDAMQRLLDRSHSVLPKSALSSYPEFIAKDWSGIVLGPDSAKAQPGRTRNFRIVQIEVHPLVDGRIRVWFEIENTNKDKLSFTPEAGCRFTPEDNDQRVKFKALSELDAGKRTIAYFESREPGVDIYSLLVRDKADHK